MGDRIKNKFVPLRMSLSEIENVNALVKRAHFSNRAEMTRFGFFLTSRMEQAEIDSLMGEFRRFVEDDMRVTAEVN